MNSSNEYPIRVAIVMGKFITGGIKSVLLNYYNAIDKGKIQFDLIVDKDSEKKNYEEFTSEGSSIYEITSLKKNPIKNILEIRKILKKNRYPIIHSYLNTLNVFSMFAGFLAGTKIRVAENLSTAHPNEPKTKIKELLKPFARLFSTNLAANSYYSAEWLYGKEKVESTLILRNGLNLEKFFYSTGLREQARKNLNLDDEYLIGHIGRYQFQKNHDFIIEIFSEIVKRNKKARLLLVGYGELKEQIWEKIEEMGLIDFVIDGGSNIENIANYNAMDCFLMPSFYEGLPVVGIEAQATGLPCVFSTEITKEAKIIDCVEFLSLEDNIELWCNTVLKYELMPRKNSTETLRSAGYDIKECAEYLTTFYENSLNQVYMKKKE